MYAIIHMNLLAIRYRSCLLGLAWILAGCEDRSTAPPAEPVSEIGPVVATDRESYSWQRDTSLTWIVANPHAVNVFYYPGRQIYLERYDDGRWALIELYGFIEADPLRLGVGDTLSASLRLSNDVFPSSGWYRVHGRVYRDSALTLLWPLGNRVSRAVWVGP